MNKPYIIGIAGCTQSGKSTFARKLEQVLSEIKTKMFHIDDYHKPKDMMPLATSPVTGIEYIDFNQPVSFDLPQLRADLQAAINANTVDIIIAEGTLILYDEAILPFLDLKLYVDAKSEEQAKRYIELYSQYHGHDFIKNSYTELVRYRMEEYVEPTKWRADVIISGSSPFEKTLEMIACYVKTIIN